MNFNGLRNCFESSSLRASTQNSDRHFKIHLNFYMSPNIRNSAVYPSFARRHPAVPTLLRIVVSCKEQSKKRAGKEPSRVKCHTAAHGGGSEEALCGKHVASMQKAEAGPLKGRAAIRHAPALAKRPVINIYKYIIYRP